MFSDIYQKEMQEAFSSRKMVTVTALCCVLIPISVLVNQRALSEAIHLQRRAVEEYRQSLEGQVTSEDVEVKAFREPATLAGLVGGLDTALPNAATISQRGLAVGESEFLNNPIAKLFGTIDLLFIVQFVLSLVAISLSYNLISGEKELGTLRLILSNPVPRDSILFGKVASALTILILPFLLGTLGSLAILLMMGDRAVASSRAWLEIGLLLVTSILYLSAFVNLGVLVSTWTTRSISAMTVLLALWVGLVAIVPQTAGLAAAAVYPVEEPSSHVLRKKLVEGDLKKEQEEELRPLVGRDNYDDLREPIAQKYEARLQSIHSRMEEEYEIRRRNQRRLAVLLASLSPASSYAIVGTAVAGTGMLQAEHFTDRLRQFRSRIHEELFADSYRDVFLGSSTILGGSMRFELVDLETLPQFDYERPPLGQVLAAVWPQILILFGLNLVCLVVAYLRFRRYDVR